MNLSKLVSFQRLPPLGGKQHRKCGRRLSGETETFPETHNAVPQSEGNIPPVEGTKKRVSRSVTLGCEPPTSEYRGAEGTSGRGFRDRGYWGSLCTSEDSLA